MIQVNLFTKQRNSQNELMVAGGGGDGWEEGIVREFGVDVHTATFKMDNQQGPIV